MAIKDFRFYDSTDGWVSFSDIVEGVAPGTAEGQLLHWNGSEWVAAGEGTEEGQLLVWDATAKMWVPMQSTGEIDGKPVKPVLPIGSADGRVNLYDTDGTGVFTIQSTGVDGESPEPVASFYPEKLSSGDPQPNAGVLMRQSHFRQDGKIHMWEPGTSREPVVVTDDAQATTKLYVDQLVSSGAGNNTLPIESEDGTVVLDSPEADVFTIATAGSERLRVRQSGTVGIGGQGADTTQLNVFQDAPVGNNPIVVYVNQRINDALSVQSFGHLQSVTLDGVAADLHVSFAINSVKNLNGSSLAEYRGLSIADVETPDADKAIAVDARMDLSLTAERWNIFTSSAPSYFGGQIQAFPGDKYTPPFTFFGDVGTGIGTAGAGTVVVASLQREVARFTADGNLGLGINPFFSHRLSIRQYDPVFNYPVGAYIDQRMSQPACTHSYGMLTNLIVDNNATLMVAFQCNGVNVRAGGTLGSFRAYAASDILSQGCNAGYGFHSGVMEMAGKIRYNVFAGGTAPNYFAGQIQASNSAADNESKPAYSFDQDTTTGLYSPVPGHVSVTSAGKPVLTVSQNDLSAADDYIPQNPQSLMTRQAVEALIAAAINPTPIP